MHVREFRTALFILAHGVKHAPRKLWFLCALAVGFTCASVVFGEEPLVIEKITCEGNQKATCGFIQSQTRLREGDPVDDPVLQESKLRLRLVDFFQDADIRLGKGSMPGKAVVIISVLERSSYAYRISTGGLFEPYNKMAAADLTGMDRNFSGHGDTLSMRVRADLDGIGGYYGSTLTTARLEYIRPAFLLPQMYLVAGLGGQYLHSHDDFYWYGPQNRLFSWADLALGYKLFDYGFVSAGYRYYFSNSYTVSQNNPFLRGGWDSQDDPNFPTQGSQLLFNADWYGGDPYGDRKPFPDGVQRKIFGEDYGSKMLISASFIKHFSVGQDDTLSLRLGSFQQNDPTFHVPEDEFNSLRYTHIFRRSEGGEVRKTAVYLESGKDFSQDRKGYWGSKAGATFQTKYGLVNLFVLGELR